MGLKDTGTHYSKLEGRFEKRTTKPIDPVTGYTFYDTGEDSVDVYNGTSWLQSLFTTTTSTSSSTTTTSTSTTTTSTSTTTTVSTSTTISTSTTTSI